MVGIQLSTYKINAVRKRVMYMEYVWIHLYIQNIDITYIYIYRRKAFVQKFRFQNYNIPFKIAGNILFRLRAKPYLYQNHMIPNSSYKRKIVSIHNFIFCVEQKTDVKFLVRRKYRWRGIFVFFLNVCISMLFLKKRTEGGSYHSNLLSQLLH